jgi:uncharacterized membrane protein YhhN
MRPSPSAEGRVSYAPRVSLASGTVWVFVAAAAVSAAMHLFAEYRGPAWLVYVAKPLTTLLLIAAAIVGEDAAPLYRLPVIAGLVFSLFGDIFLMLPKERFVAGLASFLVAHLFYISAFQSGIRFGARPLLLVPFVLAAGLVLYFLWPRLGRLRVPVVLYVVVLVVMAWQASARAAELRGIATYAAAIGAALFVVSDATLAINRFRRPFRAAQAVVMTTYVAAQALIALSA